MTATAAAQPTGHGAAEAPIPWGACEVPGRGYELEPDQRLSTRRQGGWLSRRAA